MDCLPLAAPDGEGNGTPLQYSCLANPMDRGVWWAAVHGVAEGQTRLSDVTFLHLLSTRDTESVLVAQLCLALSDPMDSALQAPLSMEFSRPEYESGLLVPSPGDLTDSGIEP